METYEVAWSEHFCYEFDENAHLDANGPNKEEAKQMFTLYN